MTLDELAVGKSARILTIEKDKSAQNESEVRSHLLDMGLTPGTVVKLRKKAPMGDPIEIVLRGYELHSDLLKQKQLQ